MSVDISHQWGADLDVGPTGDLEIAAPSIACSQRILRRLLTNPGDYIWNIQYGAGLSNFVGQHASVAQIAAVIRSQMLLESSVVQYPEPSIKVCVPDASQPGTFSASISYQEKSSSQIDTVTVPITG